MNSLNFDNVSCLISFICGLSFGLWIGVLFKNLSDNRHLETIKILERKNKKLIYFIRYKMNKYNNSDDFQNDCEVE